MPLTASQEMSVIVATVQDVPTGLLAASIALLWARHDDKGSLPLQRLYTQRDAIVMAMGYYRDLVNFSNDGNAYSLGDKIKNLALMLTTTTAEIAVEETSLSVDGTPATGVITRVAPVEPADRDTGLTRLDANDPAYRGDAYRRTGGLSGFR